MLTSAKNANNAYKWIILKGFKNIFKNVQKMSRYMTVNGTYYLTILIIFLGEILFSPSYQYKCDKI